MALTMHIDIVSAEESIHSGVASYILARATEGEVGVYPRHLPMLVQLRPGEVTVRDEHGQEDHYYVSGGTMEVQPHVVTILADAATRAGDIDEAAAEQARKRAEEALANRSGEIDYARAQAELVEAAAQLRTIQKLRKNTRG
ncbi:F0F1 ATP synthase subunit epsilon [Spiribacter salinus]|jgi:F-type H+-transporting ATPase subunit epsilon|uniref:ATP synthase epsilon chain n=1 Tax=Spiribacter salinus TaxID=1335746 RepID=A0A540VPX1_9GAMM|nr:F0F1 ATP synthase subunit epsilon [Spiribacter salinus]MBY5268682.1 F0F1 ATP synthase subunit epsilon [Spiribacter salinus]MDR9413833.1 F0F1 ATP synthase subunit epsilon [Spiribacter sp.]MDR9455160.1 F0F1 ATP synthase subunit epsilon [Spiribacter sp.]TQE98686.1 MAG: F0F1 ATP synthase subunit epsilon [Spiribacter salinus]